MAILLRGKTVCKVCGQLIRGGDEVVLFPHIIANEAHPLHRLSDASCHLDCAKKSEDATKLVTLVEEHYSRTGPGQRKCQVCGEEILDPDDCLALGYLGDSALDPIGRFNFTHLHKSHVADWKPAAEFLALAQAAIDEGRWKGPTLATLIRDIRANLH